VLCFRVWSTVFDYFETNYETWKSVSNFFLTFRVKGKKDRQTKWIKNVELFCRCLANAPCLIIAFSGAIGFVKISFVSNRFFLSKLIFLPLLNIINRANVCFMSFQRRQITFFGLGKKNVNQTNQTCSGLNMIRKLFCVNGTPTVVTASVSNHV